MQIKTIFISNYYFFIIKKIFIISQIISSYLFFINLFSTIFPKNVNKVKNKNNKQLLNKNINNNLQLIIGKKEDNSIISIPEKGLYQNILITGTIGSGKTSSAMYPFTKQLIEYSSNNIDKKIAMLILDVKGNYHKQVIHYAKNCNRLNDVITIELNGKYKYNPLDKPNLKPSVIANQLKTILLLFSPNNSESYWIDKAETVLCEAIKLCRLYNKGYVNFEEIHNLIIKENYYKEKIEIIRKKYLNNKLNNKKIFELLSSIEFFEKEYYSLDSRTLNILKSEITRITSCFINDYDVKETFCPKKNEIKFHGFYDILKNGKIVVLNMNIAEYRNLSKIIAAYLKIDFQTEVMSTLLHDNNKRTTAFISDEYSEYVTATDSNFFSQSREAKCINIISTQSYTSLLNSLSNQSTVKVITQNLVNKIWFRTDDMFTIEDAQKQLGKAEKTMISQTISENAKNTFYSYLTHSFNSKDSNISESINKYSHFDYIYDTNFFTQKLETFSALCFLSNGSSIIPPCKLDLLPYFKN